MYAQDNTSREAQQGVVTFDAVGIKSHSAIHRSDVLCYPTSDAHAFDIDENELVYTYENGGSGKLPVAYAVLNGAPITYTKHRAIGVSMTKHMVGDPTTSTMTIAARGQFTLQTRGSHAFQRYDVAQFDLPEIIDEKLGTVAGQNPVDRGRIYPVMKPLYVSSSDRELSSHHVADTMMKEWKEYLHAQTEKNGGSGTREEKVRYVIKKTVQAQFEKFPQHWETVGFLNDAEAAGKQGKTGTIGTELTDKLATDLYRLALYTNKASDAKSYFSHGCTLIEYVNIWLSTPANAKLIDPNIGYTMLHADIVRLFTINAMFIMNDLRGKAANRTIGLVMAPTQAMGKTKIFVDYGSLSS